MSKHGMGGRHLGALVGCGLLLVVCLTSDRAAAKSLIAENPEDLYHWAYAAAFGTGAYRFGESDLYAIRINPKIPLTTFHNERFTLNLRLPVTIGLQSIDVEDIVGTPIDEQFATFSFVPGLGLTLPLHPRWTLNPYVNYGWGTELQGDSSAWIYFAGINSRFRIPSGRLNLTLLNGVQWLGNKIEGGTEERFARFINGLEAAYPLGDWEIEGRRLYLKPHAVHYWYFDSLNLSILEQRPVELNQEVEVALALGTQEHLSLWMFKFDRVGIGYRKGDEIEGVRLFFDSVFD